MIKTISVSNFKVITDFKNESMSSPFLYNEFDSIVYIILFNTI